MTAKKWCAVAALAVFTGCHANFVRSGIAADVAAISKSIDTTEAVVNVPFLYDSTHILVPAFLSRSDTLWFILDLGASSSVFWPETHRSLGGAARSLGTANVQGAGGVSTAEVIGVDSVRLGRLVRKDLHAVVMDLERSMELPSGQRIRSGLIGRDVIRGHDVVIDFAARRLYLYPSSSDYLSSLASGASFGCAKSIAGAENDELVVPVTVNDQSVNAYFDIGSVATTIGIEVADRLGITRDSPGVNQVKRWTGGVGGRVDEYEVRGLQVTVAGIPLRQDVIRFGDGHFPSIASVAPKDQPRAFLGLNSISDRTLVVLYSKGELCFNRAAH